MQAGIHPSTLYAMRDDRTLETVSRGVYRLADSEPLGDPDLVSYGKISPDSFFRHYPEFRKAWEMAELDRT